jgi:hypothetical protein
MQRPNYTDDTSVWITRRQSRRTFHGMHVVEFENLQLGAHLHDVHVTRSSHWTDTEDKGMEG